MATTPEVKIKISGDPKGFDAAIKTVQGSLKRLSGDLSGIQSIAAKALNFGGIGGAASVAGLVTLATNLTTVAKEISNLALVSNVGTQEFQRLAFGAKTVGVEQEKLADIFKDVSDKVGEFLETGGGPLADFFTNIAPKIGVTAAQFQNLSGPQALQLYMSSLEKANLSQSQMTFYMEAIASDAARLTPLLKENGKGFREAGDQAERLGVVLGDDLVKQALELEQTMVKFRALSTGVAVDIGSVLIPALNNLASEYLNANRAGLGFFEALVGIGMSNPTKTAKEQIASLTDEIDRLQKSVAASEASSIGSIGEAFGAQDAKRLQTAIKLRKYYELQVKASESAEVDINKQKNDAILKAEGSLSTAVARLKDLQIKQSRANATEELKGAERLKAALQAAWQASIDGAKKAREESKELVKKSGDAKTTAADSAKERLSRDNTPQEEERDARIDSEKLRSEANFAASSAVVASFQGRLADAKRLADDALVKSAQAKKLSEKILNNKEAATLITKLGEIDSDANKALARVKEKEAVELEKTGEGQNKEIDKNDERIKTLKAELEKPVNLTLDIVAAQAAIKTIQGQLDELKSKTITVTVNTVAAGAAGKTVQNMDTGEIIDIPTGSVTPRGFAAGGYTGAGGKFQPAGIVHAGEYVLRQEVVRQKGMRSLLDRLNMEGINAVAKRGYANGGLVGDNAAQTPINLNWPDGSTSRVSAESSVAKQIEATFRRAALARGGRRT